jgi:hypothetical protein
VGGEISNGASNAQRYEPSLHCAYVTPETTRDVMGLGDPVARCLAHMGMCNERGDGGQLEMTQEVRKHRLLGNGGNDPERAASAPGTWGQSQIKHAFQKSCPAPVRRPCPDFVPIHTLPEVQIGA